CRSSIEVPNRVCCRWYRNFKSAALAGWPQSSPAQKREAPSGGADDASETGHRGGGRSRVADTMLKASVGSSLYRISFLSEPERLQGCGYLAGCMGGSLVVHW